MELEIIALGEVSQTKEEKYCTTAHMQNLKETIQINLFTKQKQTQGLGEGTWGPWREGVGRDSQRVWERGTHYHI